MRLSCRRFRWFPRVKRFSKALDHCAKGFFCGYSDIEHGMSDGGEVERFAPGAELGGLLVNPRKSLHGFLPFKSTGALERAPRLVCPSVLLLLNPPSALFASPKKQRGPVSPRANLVIKACKKA